MMFRVRGAIARSKSGVNWAVSGRKLAGTWVTEGPEARELRCFSLLRRESRYA